MLHLIGLVIVVSALCAGFIVGKRRYNQQRDAQADAACAVTTPTASAMTAGDEPTSPTPHEKPTQPTAEEPKAIDEVFIARARAIVAQHIDDSDWTIESFAREMELSQPVFSNKLRTQTGMLPNDLIREMRMEEACRLIRTGEYDIATIGYKVGFSDPKYLTRVFKKQYGVPPSKFREQAEAQPLEHA